MVIVGLEILNEGGGLTELMNTFIDDIIAATNISGVINGWFQGPRETKEDSINWIVLLISFRINDMITVF